MSHWDTETESRPGTSSDQVLSAPRPREGASARRSEKGEVRGCPGLADMLRPALNLCPPDGQRRPAIPNRSVAELYSAFYGSAASNCKGSASGPCNTRRGR